jgi:hypothetical protein
MTVQELIDKLKTSNQPNKPLLGTITRYCGKQNVTIFSEHDDYREIFISEFGDIEPMTIAEAIAELELTEHKDIDIILTYGNEDSDIFSTKGGVDFKFGGLFADGVNSPQQA